MRIKHILVATDFGESSQRAENLALDLASKLDAKVTLLHVWSVPTPVYAEAFAWPTIDIETAAREALEIAVERAKAKYPPCEAVLVAGIAWDSIVAVAKQRAVDLIVMGTHGRRGLPRFVLGSVAEKVVRVSPVPVLTVGPEASNADPPKEA